MRLFRRLQSPGRVHTKDDENRVDQSQQDAIAHYNLGSTLLDQRRLPDALASYRRALEIQPNFAEAHCNLGIVQHQLGHLDEAVMSYRRAVEIKPDFVTAHYNRANALLQLGQLEDAAANYRRALELQPEFAEAHCNLGIVLQQLGRIGDALTNFRRAVEIRPLFAQALYNHANALREVGQFDDAIATYHQALEIQPDYAEARLNLGNTLKDSGRFEDAMASYHVALEIRPEFAEAHCSLGSLLQKLGRHEDAVVSFRRALAINPEFAEAHFNQANALYDLGQLDNALASYRRALSIKPDYVAAHSNLGNVQRDSGRLGDAIASFHRALAISPEYVEAHVNLGNALKDCGRLDDAVTSYRRALEIKPDFAIAHSNLLFALNYSARHTHSHCLEEARQYGKNMLVRATRFSDWSCVSEPKQLRVGLVSGDFRNHPVGFFLEGLLRLLDPTRVELIAYPTFEEADETNAIIRRQVSTWKPLVGQSDEAATRLIHADGVHVLLDLSGHTDKNRLPIFASKPAPVQCTWLGYFATTGVPEIDFLLGDPYVTPVEEESHFTERIWRLPDAYMCFAPPRVELEVGALPALSVGSVTFGCFNNLAKMNDAVVALWARILQAVPGSRLLLKTVQLNDLAVRETTHQRFATRGIAADRLILEGSSPRAELLAAYNRVDIALDPFPYPGGTTSVEGLWMGVPFITRRGDRFLSHVGETIAQNSGLSDWIAADDEDYLVKATEFASNLPRLSNLRAGLRPQVLASPMFDAARFARNFEAALWGMWRSWDGRKVTSA